jgi:hypothetical protein
MKVLTINERIAFNFIFYEKREFHRWSVFGSDYGSLKRVFPRISNLILSFARTFTSVKTYGGLEFFMTVLSRDMIAPQFGTHKLQDFFEKELRMNYEK